MTPSFLAAYTDDGSDSRCRVLRTVVTVYRLILKCDRSLCKLCVFSSRAVGCNNTASFELPEQTVQYSRFLNVLSTPYESRCEREQDDYN